MHIYICYIHLGVCVAVSVLNVCLTDYKPNSLSYNQKIVNKSNVVETLTQVCVAYLKNISKCLS